MNVVAQQTVSSGASVTTEAERERFRAFADDLRARGRSPKTLRSYESDWRGFAEWFSARCGAPFDAVNMDGEAVGAYRAALLESGRRPATVNRKLVFLKRYSTWVGSAGGIGPDARSGVRAVEPVAQRKRRPRGLSDLEQRRFLQELDRRGNERDKAIVHTLLETGLRVSELVSLERADVHINGKGGRVAVRGARAARRELCFGAVARRTLLAWLVLRGEHPGAMFTGERGPLTANAVQRLVRKYGRFAKVEASPGTLRHTFASHHLDAVDGDLVALADAMGHESLETTRLYLPTREEAAGPPGRSRPGVVRAR
jgi:site-specific recombinase XerC